MFQIVDLSPGFLPLTVGSLYIFLYFILHSLHFFSFCDHSQPLLWASWLPVFWTVHLIGWLSLHHLVLFFVLDLFFHGSIYLCWACLLQCKGWRPRCSPGWGNPGHCMYCCMWGRGPRGINAASSSLSGLSVTSLTTLKQIGPIWCWFPCGCVCVCSRTLWVSGRNSPMKHKVPPAATVVTGFLQQEVLGLYCTVLEPWVVQSVSPLVVPLGLCACKCGTAQSASCCLTCLLLEPPPGRVSSMPHLHDTSPPARKNECFFFHS